jgi:hypothetical protein
MLTKTSATLSFVDER